ncbi:hypothetical protein K435DRAFT_861432 [Dendrothele bispora CBS 962.96]|uniref:DNA breaking-rejoining enzyme n=1 Tax=Dendrothele bispora (strain CBS 962.96) TaxID=1314807 RepID=A0A4S8LVB0_DENBC|nr:hypothetical protein K435DRAFT_861432 [Dendrothele bispora CBS 962.96]
MPKASKKSGKTSTGPASSETKKTAKPQKKTSKSKPQPKPPRSFQKFVKDAQEQQRKHGKSENTSTNYQSAIVRTRKWLAAFVANAGDAGQLFEESREFVDLLGDHDEDEEVEEETPSKYRTMPEDFATCLDGCPTATTPLAITLFMYTKCFEEGKGDSTAWHIFAGWKYHFDQMCEGKYRGQWKEDRESGEWVGNPTSSALVSDMLTACKNKDGEAERKHSRAMTVEDMVTLFFWSWNICPDDAPVTTIEERMLKTEHLFFRAFTSTAFTLWTRNCETSTLKAKDIDWSPEPRPNAPPGDPPAITVGLRERKGWQRKQNKGETQLNGHLYHIPYQPKIPAIDMKTRLEAWKGHYETHLLRRPLEPEDYIFPSISTNRKSDHVHFSMPIPAESTKKKVNEFAASAGLSGAGRYTTHCFRRGGAQYRFMYAPIGQRWTLAMVRWWGGWSPKERHDTLVRYLLDELHTYEQDHSDALFPVNLAKGFSYLGEAAEEAPLKTSEARMLFSNLKTWITQPRTDASLSVNYRQQVAFNLNHNVTDVGSLFQS